MWFLCFWVFSCLKFSVHWIRCLLSTEHDDLRWFFLEIAFLINFSTFLLTLREHLQMTAVIRLFYLYSSLINVADEAHSHRLRREQVSSWNVLSSWSCTTLDDALAYYESAYARTHNGFRGNVKRNLKQKHFPLVFFLYRLSCRTPWTFAGVGQQKCDTSLACIFWSHIEII